MPAPSVWLHARVRGTHARARESSERQRERGSESEDESESESESEGESTRAREREGAREGGSEGDRERFVCARTHAHACLKLTVAGALANDGAGMQWLEVMVTLMLARERRVPTDDAGGCTPFAAALAALPSRPLELAAEAVVALGCADVAQWQ